MDARDGQQSESVTKKFLNVAPRFSNCLTCAMYWTRFHARSSVRTKTMFGFFLCCAFRCALAPPPVSASATSVSKANIHFRALALIRRPPSLAWHGDARRHAESGSDG